MKKQLTQICSVVLSLAVSAAAYASGPQFAKAVSPDASGTMRVEAAPRSGNPVKFKTVKTARKHFTGSSVNLKSAVKSTRISFIDRAIRKAPVVIPELTGYVGYSNAWLEMETPPVGLYTIPTSSAGEFEIKFSDIECTSGVEVNGSYYWMVGYDMGFFQFAMGGVYNLETGKSEWSSSLDEFSDCAIDMAFDKSAAWPLVYGLNNGGHSLSYYQFNAQENAITAYKVADLDKMYMSLAVDASGQLYTVDTQGILYKLDKSTGKTDMIGDTGFTTEYLGGCVIDGTSGKMYRTLSNDAPAISGIVEIDLTTGAGTLLCEFPNEEAVSGLYISGEGVADDPSAVVPPYTNTFDTEASIEGFTVINANNDSESWFWTSSSFLGQTNGFMRMSYNSDMKMDDWLISVPLRLKGGETYEVSIKAWTNSFDERVELCYGSEPTVAGMTNHIVTKNLGEDDVQLKPATVQGSITPEKSGLYYIGIHGISDADMMYLSVDDLTVTAPLSSRVPAQVSNLSAVAAAGGVKSVTVSFEAPTTDVNGAALSAISKIEVYRNDTEEVLKTYEGVSNGQTFTFIDTPAASGTYTYTVYAYNEYGRGAIASVEVFCGIGLPVDITDVKISENAVPGMVTLSWTPVTQDRNGLELDASDVTYSVYGPDDYGYFSDLIKSGITGTDYSFKAVDEGDQQFVQYAVCAVTESGEGLGTFCDMIAAGTPYDVISESFGDGKIVNGCIWGVNSSEYAQWNLFTEETGIPSQDGDNGFIGMVGQYIDEWGELYTGKVDLKGIPAPGLTFFVYNLKEDDTNVVSVDIRTVNGEWNNLFEKPTNEISSSVGWVKVTISLAAYANDVVQLKLKGIVNSYQFVLFDKIKVGGLVANDLEAAGLVAPASVAAGAAYDVAVNVANEGTAAATGWSVELYADGELAETAAGSELVSGNRTQVVFHRTMGALATEAVTYKAKVVFAADENPANNETSAVDVAPVLSKLPAVKDLKGENTSGGVKLTWTAPNLEEAPADPVTVSFEDGGSFAKEYAGWTFIDNDMSPVGGFQGTDLPGIEPGTTTASFFVFDASIDGLNQSFAAHTGDKYLAALFRYDDGATDDWAISSELSGEAQSISFYARSYSATYPEKIEVYYSTGSLDTKDFVKVVSATTVPDAWTLFSAEIPVGATRLAIRSCATSSFMLMLDDITYTPAGQLQGVEIKGYNVYRNGVLVTSEPVTDTEFVDADAPEGSNTYVVTVVYNREESRASNEISVETSGVSHLAAGIKVYAVKGAVVIEGALEYDATVVAASGRTMFRGVCSTRTEIAVPTGVYIVSINNKTIKVFVK